MNVVKEIEIVKYDGGNSRGFTDIVVKEYAFTLVLNGDEFITMLCSPSALEFLTVGYLLSEGLIKNKQDIKAIKLEEDKGRVEVDIENPNGLAVKLFGRRTLTTGCGRGTVFYNTMDAIHCKRIEIDTTVSALEIIGLMRAFNRQSEVFEKTGGVHSAGLCTRGEIILFHEDVGRHNALDKVIGEALLKEIDVKDKLLITSGRISSEMLIKAGKQQIPIVVSRSAPTDLALQVAEQLNITVVGFVRGQKMNIYTAKDRILI